MKNNNLNYVKIPREIIYDKDLSPKRVIIFSYLCARRSLDDTVAFSTTELCHWSKLKPNYRNDILDIRGIHESEKEHKYSGCIMHEFNIGEDAEDVSDEYDYDEKCDNCHLHDENFS